jgi:hypothetical protein
MIAPRIAGAFAADVTLPGFARQLAHGLPRWSPVIALKCS